MSLSAAGDDEAAEQAEDATPSQAELNVGVSHLLPAPARAFMISWFDQHLDNPFPTKAEKVIYSEFRRVMRNEFVDFFFSCHQLCLTVNRSAIWRAAFSLTIRK